MRMKICYQWDLPLSEMHFFFSYKRTRNFMTHFNGPIICHPFTALSWQRGLQYSVKVWAMLCKSSDKMWSTGGGNGNPLQYSCLENPVDSWKGKMIWQEKMSTPGQKMSSMLLGKSKGQLLIVTEIMKWLDQSGNDTQV